tara:strand:- start:1332 stop:2192 length:861 start_codon:yes stop_codon:yes gene_type:complete
MPWYIYAVIASLLFAVIPLQKRKYNHKPKDIMFWSAIFSFLITLLLVPFLEFPENDWFYLGAIFTGLSGVFGGILQFKLSEKRLGRVFSLQVPIQVTACFIFYMFLQPEYYQTILEDGFATFLTVLMLVILMISVQFLRKTDNTFKSLISVMPVSILFAAIIVYYKLMMNVIDGNPSHIILAYILVHYFTVALCYLLENLVSKESTISISEGIASSSMLIAVLYVFAYYFMFMAVHYAHNPALVLVFNLLTPVWIKFYCTIFGYKDDASLKVSVIMLLSLSILMLA